MLAYAAVHRNVTVLDLRQSAEMPRFEPTDLPAWRDRVHGVVLCLGYDGPADEIIGWIGRSGVPAVSVRMDLIDPSLPAVFIDPDSIARLAVDHLMAMTAASFLHVGSMRCKGPRLRAEAMVRVLAARGRAAASYEVDTLILGGVDDEATLAGDQRLTDLLTTLPRPVGILCLNDAIARAVVMRCQTLGLAIGSEALVVGVDDTAIAADATPSITSIKVSCETVAARAVVQRIGRRWNYRLAGTDKYRSSAESVGKNGFWIDIGKTSERCGPPRRHCPGWQALSATSG